MNEAQNELVDRITDILQEDDRVVAAWLEGSIARGEEDDYSDIDLWVCVKDSGFDDFIEDREQFAAQIGPVTSILYPKTLGQPDDMDSFQIILEDQPSTLRIDVDVQKQSRKMRFTKDSDAEECMVLFDTAHVVKWKPFNPQEVEEYARDLFDDAVTRFWHQLPKVIRLLARNDLLEAFDEYVKRMEELIILYRILYTPEKVEWGMKDVEYDLPEDVVKKLTMLMPYPDEKRLRKLTKQLATVFAKQSKTIAKRLKQPLPEPLMKQILSELE